LAFVGVRRFGIALKITHVYAYDTMKYSCNDELKIINRQSDGLKVWFVYIIRCFDGSLYTGITTDVARRFDEHASGKAKSAKYLRGRSPLELVYKRETGSHSEALSEERRIKRLPKVKKIRLISSRESAESERIFALIACGDEIVR
jgi:putative endonuclease